MKNTIFILLGLIAIVITSCNISSTSNNTPEIYFVSNPVVNRADTLFRYSTDDPSVTRMDTILVGDTVTFHMLFYGYSNNLSVCTIVPSDTTSTKILLPPSTSLDSVFLSTASDYSLGKFVFKNKVSSLYFPFKYVAKKATNDAKITFYLSSDATFNDASSVGNNSVSFVLKTPVKQPKVIQAVKKR